MKRERQLGGENWSIALSGKPLPPPTPKRKNPDGIDRGALDVRGEGGRWASALTSESEVNFSQAACVTSLPVGGASLLRAGSLKEPVRVLEQLLGRDSERDSLQTRGRQCSRCFARNRKFGYEVTWLILRWPSWVWGGGRVGGSGDGGGPVLKV